MRFKALGKPCAKSRAHSAAFEISRLMASSSARFAFTASSAAEIMLCAALFAFSIITLSLASAFSTMASAEATFVRTDSSASPSSASARACASAIIREADFELRKRNYMRLLKNNGTSASRLLALFASQKAAAEIARSSSSSRTSCP